MSLQLQTNWRIPAQTAATARAAFPKGNVYMKMRDVIGHLYEDEPFQTLFRRDWVHGHFW
jgi:transposase